MNLDAIIQQIQHFLAANHINTGDILRIAGPMGAGWLFGKLGGHRRIAGAYRRYRR